MPTIHEEIEGWLAADVHDELSPNERASFEAHLAGCATCGSLQKEEHAMNKLLNETLAEEKADPAFEERMLSGFRRGASARTPGILSLIADLLRTRSAQLAAAAAVLLTLVQVGRMVTNEERFPGETRQTLSGLSRASNRLEKSTSTSFTSASAAKEPASEPAGVTVEQEPQPAPVGGDSFRADALKTAPLEPRSKKAMADAQNAKQARDEVRPSQETEAERTIVTSSNMPRADEVGPSSSPASVTDNRKLIRNAQVELEIVSFDVAVQKITGFANEERGYIATSSSKKQANGKLRGNVVVKVVPENLGHFLQKLRGVGELKNQTLGSEDVTKQYFDTDARLKNARVMEQRLIEMLKTKSNDVADLLAVEKELGRVREEIEQMQGGLKFMDAQVEFATVTIALAEKDMNVPAAFLLKERAQLALYSPNVEKIYNDIKALASLKTQITNAQLDRDNSGRVSARLSILIAPEESDAVIARVKGMGRVENFQVQTERVAQGGTGMSENAKTERDKVELNITISRDEQEQALQQTTLRIRTETVDENVRRLREIAEKANGRIRSSSFSRNPNGRETANVSLRVPMRNYTGLLESLGALGKLENVSVTRQDRTGEQTDEANAPADVSIQVYSQGNIVSEETGIIATLRRTLAQGASALMWSVRMIGVAVAFLAPWAIALAIVTWILLRITRARRTPLDTRKGE